MAEKILVVDDDLDTLRLVGLMLERQGYKIAAANTGQQALDLAKSEKPDLVVLDLMMPDIDGVTIARQLRADPATKDILIVMFTARGQTEEKLEGFEAGADAYLTKPTQPRELMAQVKAVLQRAGRGQAAAQQKEYTLQGRLIGVLAAKGGVGVSTLALNLGIAMRGLSRKSVILSDFRPGSGSIGLELGYDVNQGLIRFLGANPATISPAAIENELTEHVSGMQLLLSSARPQDAQVLPAAEGFEALAKQLPYLAHYIILDLGSALSSTVENLVTRCEQLIVVLEPVPQTVKQTRLLVDYLVSKGVNENVIYYALINRLRAGMQLSMGQVQDLLGRNVTAIFTAAPELAYQAQTTNTPIILRQPDGISAEQFLELAKKVIQRLG